MARLIGPGNSGEIDVRIPRGGMRVGNLRDSYRIPDRYSFAGRNSDGSIRELRNREAVADNETINLIPEHKQG